MVTPAFRAFGLALAMLTSGVKGVPFDDTSVLQVSVMPVANHSSSFTWKFHEGKSCQSFADNDATRRSLEESKELCLRSETCVAIECDRHDTESSCTLRAIANLIEYDPVSCYEMLEVSADGTVLTSSLHPAYHDLLKEYPFQQVTTQTGNPVNIMLVRSQPNAEQLKMYERYKNDILFLGISSMNDYPLPSDHDPQDFTGTFPGFLHMMHEPEKSFPPHVKTLLLSQSDFSLPDAPARDYTVPRKYDFTYSASDCDVELDGHGWCGWSKNWTFVHDSLGLMCEKYNLRGVLVATKNKANTQAYSIPKSCEGKMIQTTYLANQQDYFNYLRQSRFAFLPQIHDASPRVSTQALALDVPILMNNYIKGGWKYVNEQTGEFFHDMSDFEASLKAILQRADRRPEEGGYEPRKWVLEHAGNHAAGKQLLEFVQNNFADRVKLPKGTKALLC